MIDKKDFENSDENLILLQGKVRKASDEYRWNKSSKMKDKIDNDNKANINTHHTKDISISFK